MSLSSLDATLLDSGLDPKRLELDLVQIDLASPRSTRPGSTLNPKKHNQHTTTELHGTTATTTRRMMYGGHLIFSSATTDGQPHYKHIVYQNTVSLHHNTSITYSTRTTWQGWPVFPTDLAMQSVTRRVLFMDKLPHSGPESHRLWRAIRSIY